MTFGIVSFGHFAQLWANALLAFGELFVYKEILIN